MFSALLFFLSFFVGLDSNAHFNFSQVLENYEKVHRPSPNNNFSEPVTVLVRVAITTFGQFDHQEMEFKLNMQLIQHWVDPRLIFHNQTSEMINFIHFRESIWLPDLYFPKAVDGNVQQVTTPNYMLWVYPNGEVVYSQKVRVGIACTLELWRFPLDDQVCNVDLSTYAYSSKEVQLRWLTFNSSENVELGENNLNEFMIEKIETINNSSCCSFTLGHFSCIQMKFYFKRNREYYIMQTYVPTFLVVMLSWLSFLIDYSCAPARISMGLLSILTLITQGTLVLRSMPKISYIKAIDVWLFTCLAFVITALIEFAAVYSLCRQGPKPLLGRILVYLNKRSNKSRHSRVIDNDHNDTIEMKRLKESDAAVGDKKNERLDYFDEQFGNKVDAFFFVIYPILFTTFNIFYWTVYNSYEVI